MIYFILIAAPCIYWAFGIGLVVRLGFSPGMPILMGGAVAGLSIELATVTGISANFSLSIVFVVAMLLLWLSRNQINWKEEAKTNGIAYLAALVPALASPFAILGNWDGDWLLLYQGGQAIYHGEELAGKLLERPPLFGACAAPLWYLQDSLASYQVFCAVMSAGLLTQLYTLTCQYFPSRPALLTLLPIVLSVFFLHHTAACWGKLMAAAFVLAACAAAYQDSAKHHYGRAAFLFATSVAIHQSSIFYILLIAAIYWCRTEVTFNNVLRSFAIYAATGLIVVGLFESWTILRYGLEAKINANPSSSQRPSDIPFATNIALILLSSFFGWAPVSNIVRWMNELNPMTPKNAISESFWLVVSWFQIQAGTFFGVALPFLLAAPRDFVQSARQYVQCRSLKPTLTAAIILILILNAAVNPFHSDNGSMQTGLVPLGLLLIWALGLWASSSMHLLRRAAVWLIAVSFVPWIGLMLLVNVGMNFSASFREIIQNGSEGDWGRLTANGLIPLGLSVFPIAQTALLATIFFIAIKYTYSNTPDSQSHVQIYS